MSDVIAVIGAEQIGQAIARRVSAGKHVVLADLHQTNADAAAEVLVSPSQARPEAILAVDLYGTALVLEEFGNIIASGGSGVVIASQSGHCLGALTAEQDAAVATTPADELLALPMLQPGQVTDTLHAYQLAKRGPHGSG